MEKEEFKQKVREDLLEGIYPDDDGRPSKLSEEEVDEMLSDYDYLLDDMIARRQEYKTEQFWIQATAYRIWTVDAC